MDWFKSKKDKEKEQHAKNMKEADGALEEAEQALEGDDPLQEAVKKNQKEQG